MTEREMIAQAVKAFRELKDYLLYLERGEPNPNVIVDTQITSAVTKMWERGINQFFRSTAGDRTLESWEEETFQMYVDSTKPRPDHEALIMWMDMFPESVIQIIRWARGIP